MPLRYVDGGAIIPVTIMDGSGNSQAVSGNVAVFTSASWAYSHTSNPQSNPGFKGAYIIWDITAVPGAGETAQLFVDILQPDGSYTAIYQTAALATVGVRKYLLYPGAVDTGSQLNQVCQLPLPSTWHIRILHSAGGNFTYAVGVYYVN